MLTYKKTHKVHTNVSLARWNILLLILAVIASFSISFLYDATASALSSTTTTVLGGAAQLTAGPGGDVDIPKVAATTGNLELFMRMVFAIIGAASVVYVVLGGIKYVYSSGEPQKAASAKQTIIYALIGLAVSLSAQLIVGIVLSRL